MPSNPSVLLTGASSTLGQALLSQFLTNHFKITGLYHQGEGKINSWLEKNKNTVLNEEIHFESIDLTQANEFKEKWKKLPQHYTSPDLFIHCAGKALPMPFIKSKPQDINNLLNLHLNSTKWILDKIIPKMIDKKKGHIIFISSYQTINPNPGNSLYALTKSTLHGFTKSLAKELGPWGIQVNTILPGLMKSSMTHSLSPKVKNKMLEGNALNKFSSPEEIARFIFFLSSFPEASGQIFNLDSRIIP